MITRTYPEVGDFVMTPQGIEKIVSIDNSRDMALTDLGNTYVFEDVLMTDPPRGGSVEDIEKWLDGNAYILVTSVNLICSCLCNNCNMLVVTRGAEVTRTHQTLNSGCSCADSVSHQSMNRALISGIPACKCLT